MLEIHRDLVADDGLNLAQTPVGARLQAHERANFYAVHHDLHIGRFTLKDQ